MVQLGELFGFIVLASALALGCQEHERHAEDLVVDQLPEELAIDVGSGDVRLIGADISEVRVSAWIDGPSNHVGHGVVDGRVTLFDECNQDPCSVDLTVTFPRSSALTLRTGSGDVHGLDLAGFDFTAETGSGDLSFEFNHGARRVQLRTGSGDVAVTVPSGGYRLNLSTGSGDQEIAGVSNDPSATRAIDVHTGSGDLRLIGR